MTDDDVLFERVGALGLITLNRPKALNALTHAMCLAVKAQLDGWARDTKVTAVAIRGAGDRSFCAGGDIRALYESGKAGTPYALAFYRDEFRLNAAIKHFPKPYVALLRGVVMGGGVGVSVHGSHRVADETAVFAMPETGIGLFPDVGGSHFLPRCPGEIGMHLALTGSRLKTADMLYAGISTHHVPAERTTELIDRMSQGEMPDAAIRALAQDLEPVSLGGQRAAIDRMFSASSVEAIVAALDAEGGEWARTAVATLNSKSPTSLKITYRQIREGRRLGFDDCMRMEFRMVNRIIAGHDFYEGVRAAIIDKDNEPKWRPAVLDAVGDSDVAEYFAPLSGEELIL